MILRVLGGLRFSGSGTHSLGRAHSIGGLGPRRGALGATLAHQQQADAFQQFRRRVHALGQKNIGPRIAIVDPTLPENRMAGVWGEMVLIFSMSLPPSTPGMTRSVSTRSTPPF